MPDESGTTPGSTDVLNVLKQPQVGVAGAEQKLSQVRAEFGSYLIWAFIAGLAFFGAMIAAEVALVAVNRKVFLEVDDVVKVATTFGSIIGPPLGFVISYFFKEREER